jgi:hypothetical protein
LNIIRTHFWQLLFAFILQGIPFCCPLIAQQISVDSVIFSALRDENLLRHEQHTEQVRQLRFKVPYIRRAEARIGTNGSTLGDTLFGSIRNEDFYGFVIGPNSLRERRKQEALHEAYIRQFESARTVLLAAALLERYTSTAEWYHAQKIGAAQQKLSDLMAQKMDILRAKMDQGLSVKPGDVLDTERDFQNIQNQILETQQTVQYFAARLAFFLPENAARIDTLGFITGKTIESRGKAMLLMGGAATDASPALAWRSAKNAVANADYALEKAQDRQIFNFLQIGYEDPIRAPIPNRRRTFNNFSVRLALSVPISGNNNPQRAAAAIDAIEAQQDLMTTQWTLNRNITLQTTQFNQIATTQATLKIQKERSLALKMLNAPAMLQQMTAEEISEAQIMVQKMAVQIAQNERSLCLAYIRLLDLKGWTTQMPLRNYLRE